MDFDGINLLPVSKNKGYGITCSMKYLKGLKEMPSLYWNTDLYHQPALVVSGRFVLSEGEMAVASGGHVFILIPDSGEYRVLSSYDTGGRGEWCGLLIPVKKVQ
ncbi:MAG: hypothetical protein ACOY30_08675 [Bacillota bacterium]